MGKIEQSLVSILQVEREIGITKETLRKWESRYGFPNPLRQASGERLYTPAEVERLRLITRLIGAGHRPGKVVALPIQELKVHLAKQPGKVLPRSALALSTKVIAHLHEGNVTALANDIEAVLLTQGLSTFVETTLPPLIIHIGDQWGSGRLAVYQEHLFSEVLRSILQRAVLRLQCPPGSARVLMGTAPEELHGMGLLMLQAVLAVAGAQSINLGTQTPLNELVRGASGFQVDVVAISFSLAYPSRRIAPFVLELRRQLPAQIDLWAGGAGVDRLHTQWPGVQRFKALSHAVEALASRAKPAVQG